MAKLIKKRLIRNWWLFLLRGILILVFGILALINPGSTLLALAVVFGSLIMVSGFFFILAAFFNTQNEGWGWVLFEGLVDVLFGIVVLSYPIEVVKIFILILAIWVLMIGIVQIVASLHWRKIYDGWWIVFTGGLASVIFGFLFLSNPFGGAAALMIVIGIYAMLLGASVIYLAFRIKNLTSDG
ncbi:HdeD family acid-resistance protein [Rapidithrix thailandica]|uniref:HdeD family acid-resistance protein n=1 Tax=Rapidithrix thailandica TaxID=413964 RepID=A0AAW9S4A4_9BACT